MANQIVVSAGAKVRNLNGVLTGTSGVVSSVPLGAANGVATLDSGGKVPVSQLPSSVVTYLGTWNAATNTPTLVNGTGDAGDMYICNVAGTVNFGAGPVTFAVGDWVLYGSGTWQKSSGQNGTVTSVAFTESGDSLNITGSPITTSGTINIGFNGTNLQYVNGAGNLTTFPILTGYVPYTGATQDVDLGAFKLNAQSLHIKGTAGNGHLGLKHQSASATASANEVSLFADSLGDLAWQNANLYLSKFITSANTANRSYTFPNANGTVALTSDISYPVTSVFGRTGAVVATSGDYTTTQVTEGTNLYYTDSRARLALSLTTTGTSGAATYNNTTGVFNIPNYAPDLSGYVTLAGSQTITGAKTFSTFTKFDGGVILKNNVSASLAGYVGLSAYSASGNKGINIDFDTYSASFYFSGTLPYQYTFPAATGTIALVGGSGVGTVTSVAALTIGTTGTDLSSSVATSTTTPVITLNVPTASATNRGALSSADWTTFNNKQSALTNPVTGTGTTNYLPKFTGASTIGDSLVYDNGTNVGVNQPSPTRTLDILGASGVGTVLKLQGASGTTTYLQMAYNGATNAQSGYIGYNSSSQMQFFTNDTVALTIDSNRNLGLGVTPSAWGSTQRVLEIGGPENGYIAFNPTNLQSYIYWNAYYDTDNRYKKSSQNAAAFGVTSTGNYAWFNAPSGTAGAAITFTQAMTLFANGNLAIGTTTDYSSKLVIIPSSNPTSSTGSNNQISIGEVSNNTGYCLKVGYINTGGGYQGSIQSIAGGSGSTLLLNANGGNVLIGTTTNATGLLQVNGTIYATGFYESSSIVGKDIIATNPLLALDIDVIKYTRKSDESKDIRYGYSAEQIHSLMPELTDKDVTAVKYLDVHTILISQLQKEIKELKAKLN